MTVPTVACTNCGKNFTTDDLRGTSCKFCGTLLAHHARAQEQVAVVNAMLADRNGNGIPDAYEGLVANAQNQAFGQAFGMPINPYGPNPVAIQHGPYGAYGAGAPANYPAPGHFAGQEVARAGKMMAIALVAVVVVLILLGLAGAVFYFMMAGR